MTNTMKLKNKKGFTLTELIVVIVIIGILAAVLIPSLTGYITKANKSAAEQEASAYITVYNSYLVEKEAGTIESTVEFSIYAATLTDVKGTLNETTDNSSPAKSTGFTYITSDSKYKVTYTKGDGKLVVADNE